MTTKNPMKNSPRFAFFGTGTIALRVADELLKTGFTPELVVSAPDKPQGRGLEIAGCPVAEWAREHDLALYQPERINVDALDLLRSEEWDVFIVADYGMILPRPLLEIPARGTLNMHPSLLPRLRGPSPITSAILTDERNTGVTIMQLDEEMDHGPIIAQKPVALPEWPAHARDLEEILSREGGRLLAQILPHWIASEIQAQEQNHDIATYTKKFTKADGLLDLAADPYHNLLKIRAFEGWPGTYAFFERTGKTVRVQILDAHIANDALVIERVKPEGKGEMSYDEFVRGGATPLASK